MKLRRKQWTWAFGLAVPAALFALLFASGVLDGGLATADDSPCYDVDGSYLVDGTDVNIVSSYIISKAESPSQADLDKNGVITFEDANLVEQNYGPANCQGDPIGGEGQPSPTLGPSPTSPPPPTAWAACVDFDSDGDIDLDDFDIIKSWHGSNVPPASTALDLLIDNYIDLPNDILLFISQLGKTPVPPVNCTPESTPIPTKAPPTATLGPSPTAPPPTPTAWAACVDFDSDDDIDLDDLDIIKSWHKFLVPPAAPALDINSDGIIDLPNDIFLFLSQLGKAPAPNCTPESTPIPTNVPTSTPTPTLGPPTITPRPTAIFCADLDRSNRVDGVDVEIEISWHGLDVPPGPVQADINDDGTIDLANDILSIIHEQGWAPNHDVCKDQDPIKRWPGTWTATPTHTETPTVTNTPTDTPTATNTPTPTSTFTPTPTPLGGTCYDLDGNGVVDVNDTNIVISYNGQNSPPAPSIADINQDGVVDLANDILGVILNQGSQDPLCHKMISNHTHVGYDGCPDGDVDRDSDVDINDIRAILDNDGETPQPNRALGPFSAPKENDVDGAYDVDDDGDIDLDDALAAIYGAFGPC